MRKSLQQLPIGGAKIGGWALGFFLAMAPASGLACACGCGVFDVGDATLIPGGSGGAVWLEYDRLDQTQNWSGASHAPAANNSDQRILTNFGFLGGQYMWKNGFGVMAELPMATRSYTSDEAGSPRKVRHTELGDLRLVGAYAGFTPNMSTGITFGLKLPTGAFNATGFDRDVQLGTGTTDLLLGGYHVGGIGADSSWTWFAQAQWDHPLNARSGYRPGSELDASGGLAWSVSSPTAKVSITPMLQLVGSARVRDAGPKADPGNSGYERLLIAPGVELKAKAWKIYGDLEIPLYQRVNGNQLVAPVLFKVILSRSF